MIIRFYAIEQFKNRKKKLEQEIRLHLMILIDCRYFNIIFIKIFFFLSLN